MKRLLIPVVVVIVATWLVAGCVGVVKTYTDSGQTIAIGINQEFIIALGSNPTTGYTWQASYDEAMLELVGGESEYLPGKKAQEGLVGAGGTELFRFKVLQTGTTEITLVYKQPWEGGSTGETKVFTINIK